MRSDRYKTRRWRFGVRTMFVAMSLVASITACGRYWHNNYLVPRQPLPWRDFNPSLVGQLRAERRPFLVHFTANWDVTTAYTRWSVIDTPRVRRTVHELGYIPILVDCTHATADSTQFLQSYDRHLSVPLTVVETNANTASPTVVRGRFTSDDFVDVLITSRKKH